MAMAHEMLFFNDDEACELFLRIEVDDAWTWTCEAHGSGGNTSSEDEAQHMAAAHGMLFYKDVKSCELFVQEPADARPEDLETQTVLNSREMTYMEKVRLIFPRAWSRWSVDEDALLEESFNAGRGLKEMTELHERSEGGIVARLKGLGLLEPEITVEEARSLLVDMTPIPELTSPAQSTIIVPFGQDARDRVSLGAESLEKFGMLTPPPIPMPNLTHTSSYTCSICEQPVIGNSCLCRDD